MQDELIIGDLVRDLTALGIVDRHLRKRDGMMYDILETKSLRLLNRISEYCEKMGMTVVQVFEDCVEEVEVKAIDGAETLKIIEADNFFDIAFEKGLKKSKNYYDNICSLLCID
jgi:hypothetical protein